MMANDTHGGSRERDDGRADSQPGVDAALLAAMVAGDRGALGQLYDRYAPLLMGTAFRILRNRRDAEDLLHDVFLEAWRKAGDYDPQRGSVRKWLSVRVRSRALDRVRSLATARKYALLEASADDAALASGDVTAKSVDCDRALEALQCLTPAQRTVVQLGYFEGLTCSEIARRCEIPLGTVKSRLSSAIARLREQMVPAAEEL